MSKLQTELQTVIDEYGRPVDPGRQPNGRFAPGNKAAMSLVLIPRKRRITARLHEALDEIEPESGNPFDVVIAAKVRSLAAAGDMRAVEFLTDRIEGKVSQALEITGKDGGPMETITATMSPQEAARLYGQTLSDADATVVDGEPAQEAAE